VGDDTVLYVENARDVISLLLYCMAILFEQQRAFIVDNSVQIDRLRDYINHLINEPPTSVMSKQIVSHFTSTFKTSAGRGDFDTALGLIPLKTFRIFSRNSYPSKLLKSIAVVLSADEKIKELFAAPMPEISTLDADDLYQINVVNFLTMRGKESTLTNILIFLVKLFIIDTTTPKGIYYQQVVDMIFQLLIAHDNIDDADKDDVVILFTQYKLLHVTLLYTSKNAPDVYSFAILQ
jgi:hypothetical protein